VLAAHEERFRRIVSDYLERPAGDYAELLHRGYVASPEGADPEAWREEIRRQARQDKVRVITRRDGARAFAMLNRAVPEAHEREFMRRELDRHLALQQLAQTARQLGHERVGCGARVYTRLGARTVEDGEALTERCRDEDT
jgi:hypothetical protein